MISRLLVLACLCTLVACQQYVYTKTLDGTIRGLNLTHHKVFLGVPFAQAPVNELRFQPPFPALLRSYIYDATHFRNICIQADPKLPMSEDCLYLNVFVPHTATEKANVMVWIHGGNLVSGAGPYYDPEYLSNNTNTIIVSINYRLGAFGFLALDQLLRDDKTSGNYGIQDQRLAIQWVVNNIQFFGGEAKKVTIFGESAGALSVCTHLVAPRSRGLFQGAILESIYEQCNAYPWTVASQQGVKVAHAVNCTSDDTLVKCLRTVSPERLLEVGGKETWFPVVDQFELTKTPFQYYAAHDFAQVPILLGANKDEAGYFLCGGMYQNITLVGLEFYLVSTFGEKRYEEIKAIYNFSSYATPFKALVDIESDYIFKCSMKKLAQMVSPLQPTWVYSFNHVPRGTCGAGHSYELPFLFPGIIHALFGPTYTFTTEEQALADFMKSSWIGFAEGLNPNSIEKKVSWPRYNATTDHFLNLETGSGLTEGTGYRTKYCDYWNA